MIDNSIKTKLGIAYNIDALDFLSNLNDNSIDLIIIDPPYNVSRNRVLSKGKDKKPYSLNFFENDNKSEQDYKNWFQQFVIHFHRILKEDGNLFVFQDKLMPLNSEIQKFFQILQVYTWVKTNPVPQFQKINFLSGTEFATWSVKQNSLTKNRKLNFLSQSELLNYFISPVCGGHERTKHPTQKPLSLIEHLIKILSNEGDTVLDCFLGSGTTAVACENLNRNWLGCELNKDFFQIIETKLNKDKSFHINNNIYKQLSLFD